MDSLSLSRLLMGVTVVLLLFGTGRLLQTMGDLVRCIRAFLLEMRDVHARGGSANRR